MYDCAHCGIVACRTGDKEKLPRNCPTRDAAVVDSCLERYEEEANAEFFHTAAVVEAEGYCQWPRLKEVGEFCRRMGYKRIGVAFCVGLRREAGVVVDILRRYGVEVASIACKAGSVEKTAVGISESEYVRPGTYEAMCNPIAQAEFLNAAETEFNVVVGLCVGHDSLFYRYSKALVTTLVAKDRALANNPAGAIYCAESYCKDRLLP